MLTKLPPEILASILAYPGCVIALWMCGDHMLNYRLSSTVSSLFLAHIPVGDFQTPSFLLQLSKLKELTISAPDRLVNDRSNWTSLLTALPSTLESLTIDSKDSYKAFAANPSAANGQEWYDPEMEYLPIETFFPNLKSLALKGCELSVPIISALPPGLTSFTCAGSFKLPFMSRLPRSMRELNICVGSHIQAGDDELDDLAHMPPGMTIQHLTLNTNSAQVFKHLAHVSTSIDLRSNTLSTSDLLLLPSSITKLELPLNTNVQGFVTDASIWPTSLTSLTMKCSRGPGILSLLPRRLKYLRLTMMGFSTPAILHADELPPHLEEFNFTALRSIQVDGMLPSSLRSFSCYPDLTTFNFDFIPQSVTNLNLYVVSTLHEAPLLVPSSLVKLYCVSWSVNDLHCLPSSLTDLWFGSVRELSVEDARRFFSLFPPRLTVLKVERVQNGREIPFNANDLPSLTTLGLQSTVLPLASFEHLPRSLTSLRANLEGLEVVFGSNSMAFALLPPNLVECSFAAEFGDFKDLGEVWPPGSWRCLVGTPAAHHIKRLRQRLEKANSLNLGLSSAESSI